MNDNDRRRNRGGTAEAAPYVRRAVGHRFSGAYFSTAPAVGHRFSGAYFSDTPAPMTLSVVRGLPGKPA